jgi:hypothetical protein
MPHHKILEDVKVITSDNSFSGNQPSQFRKEFKIFRDLLYPRTEEEVMSPDNEHDYVSESGCVSILSQGT